MKMQYLCMIYKDEALSEAGGGMSAEALVDSYLTFVAEARDAGVLIAGERLANSSTATMVSVRGGQVILSDGPFAEATEQVGGFFLISCADLDEAIGWAARIPDAAIGKVEVRPLDEISPSAPG